MHHFLWQVQLCCGKYETRLLKSDMLVCFRYVANTVLNCVDWQKVISLGTDSGSFSCSEAESVSLTCAGSPSSFFLRACLEHVGLDNKAQKNQFLIFFYKKDSLEKDQVIRILRNFIKVVLTWRNKKKTAHNRKFWNLTKGFLNILGHKKDKQKN